MPGTRKPRESSFAMTSSRLLRPRLRTFIISSSLLLTRSSTVLIPARNKQAIVEKNDINTLPVDSIYTPVLKVYYNVESTRVGQAIDYDKLTIRFGPMARSMRRKPFLWLPVC